MICTRKLTLTSSLFRRFFLKHLMSTWAPLAATNISWFMIKNIVGCYISMRGRRSAKMLNEKSQKKVRMQMTKMILFKNQKIFFYLFKVIFILYTGCSLIVVFFLKISWIFWTLRVLLKRWCSICLVCVHTVTTKENRER